MSIILHDLVGSDPARPFSPHCWKVAMALAHKRLDFDRNNVCFTKIPEIEGGASKTVPVIRDGSQVVADSFLIAAYLEETYPDRPSLFGGEGGQALARFVESWSQSTLHVALAPILLQEVLDFLVPEDKVYFRKSREEKLGERFSDVTGRREQEIASFSAKLLPLRVMLKKQPWIGGSSPLFADYIVFGALQWARITSTAPLLTAGDPVTDWFERCLDLHDGLGRSVPPAGA
jgi:glutathione S-transferase